MAGQPHPPGHLMTPPRFHTEFFFSPALRETNPKQSMCGIFAYFYHKINQNVGKLWEWLISSDHKGRTFKGVYTGGRLTRPDSWRALEEPGKTKDLWGPQR